MRGRPVHEELSCLSSIGCPTNVIMFAKTCLQSCAIRSETETEDTPKDTKYHKVDERTNEKSGNERVRDDKLNALEYVDACYNQATHYRDQK